MTATDATARRTFADRFGAPPDRRIDAPGRVNLIGEHLDYNGLPVLPMALQRRLTVYARPREDDRVRVENADPAMTGRTFRVGPDLRPYGSGDWSEYVRAAARGVARDRGVRTGLDAFVTSDLPPAAGLSSSSALVVAFTLAFLDAAGVPVPDEEGPTPAAGCVDLAERVAAFERFVGTRGGGMDPAVILCGAPGTASRIEFEPLRVHRLPVPPEWRFVVAHSGVRARKSAAARAAYNRRVAECQAALRSAALLLHPGAPPRTWPDLGARTQPDRLLETARRLDPPLERRFRHVVTEAGRVRDAGAALLAGERNAFGRLMDASHASLRDDFEVSVPAVDRLVERARSAGAAGARLTGAGFGGCIVALCGPDDVGPLLDALREAAGKPVPGEPDVPPFVAEPSGGAHLHRA